MVKPVLVALAVLCFADRLAIAEEPPADIARLQHQLAFCGAGSAVANKLLMLSGSEVFLLVEPIDEAISARGADTLKGKVSFGIKQVVRSGWQKPIETFQRIELHLPHPIKRSSPMILMGSRTYRQLDAPKEAATADGIPNVQWTLLITHTDERHTYFVGDRSSNKPSPRLAFYAPYLHSKDHLLQQAAMYKFSSGRGAFGSILAVRELLSRKKIRASVIEAARKKPEVESWNRHAGLGFFGFLLGICGDQADAKLLQSIVAQKESGHCFEIESVVLGYLILSGEFGLDVVDRTTLTDRTSNVYSTMSALKWVWSNSESDCIQISKERLCQSMRLLLDHPEVADSAIHTLAKWQDWSIQDRLIASYSTANASVRRAIVRYVKAAAYEATDFDGNPIAETPDRVIAAKKQLAWFKNNDPTTFAAVFRNRLK